ncbi:LacI family DNA-binding transcriptional regulator [Planctomycetota bacterium]|nr:LacI family DNA-binding transcriptional regulator [Planctomycetota bacterium]
MKISNRTMQSLFANASNQSDNNPMAGASLQQVSERAGVSIATVSRVINESPLVSENTRARVLRAVRELDYQPSFAARTLAKQSTDTLGVIFPHLDDGFFLEALKGINDAASETDYHLMVAFGRGPADEMKLIRQYVQQQRVDALIIMNVDLPNRFVSSLSKHASKIVMIDRPVKGANIPTISMDNINGAANVMRHLINDHGYTDIAIITGPEGTFDSIQRLEGCRIAAKEAGITIPEHRIWYGDFSEDTGYNLMHTQFASNKPLPQAIFAFNDNMAIGVLDSMREHNRSAPDDIAVVGFDNTSQAKHQNLTTIHTPVRDMGNLAVRKAISTIKNKDATPNTPLHTLLPTELIYRRSCGCGQAQFAPSKRFRK